VGQSKEFCRLDELGYISRGRSQHRPRNAPHLYGGEFPFIQTADITRSNLYISDYSQTYTQAGVDQSRMWEPGVLCIANAGVNTGDNAILSFNACFPDSVIGFIANRELCEVRYIKYFLDSVKSQIRSITMGATQDNLSVGKLLTIPIPKLPLVSQKKIAAILSAYDDLIENNKCRIAILEKMAEEIYREWFVRFRFPGYQDAEFEKGIPKGWREDCLGNISNMVMGQSPSSEFYNETGDGLPFHQGVGTYGDRFPISKTYCSVTGRLAKKGDILFSVRAPVGRLNIANEKMIIGRGLAAISHRKGWNSYLFYFLKVAFSNEDIIGNGAIFNSVGKDELKAFKLISPPDLLVERFNALAKDIDGQIETLLRSIRILETTKNMLLPRLLSGKLSVEDLDIKFPPSMVG
jgi:type I restriction enzyme S subunit